MWPAHPLPKCKPLARSHLTATYSCSGRKTCYSSAPPHHILMVTASQNVTTATHNSSQHGRLSSASSRDSGCPWRPLRVPCPPCACTAHATCTPHYARVRQVLLPLPVLCKRVLSPPFPMASSLQPALNCCMHIYMHAAHIYIGPSRYLATVIGSFGTPNHKQLSGRPQSAPNGAYNIPCEST